MFNKLKLRKAPLSLSSVSNAIKTSGAQTLSPELSAKQLGVAMISQIGLPQDSVVAVAFDPVQSLMAVSLKSNEIRVYGQGRVEVVFEFKGASTITMLRFVKGVYLVAASFASGITVLSLHSKKILGTYSPSGSITSLESDPSFDWAILGLSNGSLAFYDVDRLTNAPMRIDNLQKKILPKHKLSSVLGIEWHPRDLGTILVTYSHSAIIYSLTDGEIHNSFVYQLDREARGFNYSYNIVNNGKKKLFGSPKEVISPLVEAHWHPNGLHIVTVHVDNTLVFWDVASGTLLEARTIQEVGLHKKGISLEPPPQHSPILNVRWVCGADPELTQLIISGGVPLKDNVMTILDFGITFKYSLTSYEKQGEFYARPQLGQRTMVVDFNLRSNEDEQEFISSILPIPSGNLLYFNGNHNPSHLVMVSNYGSLYVKRFSMLSDATDENELDSLVLPPSLANIVPPLECVSAYSVPRVHWFGILSHRASSGGGAANRLLLKGGAPSSIQHLPKPMGYDESFRNVLISGHQGGVVRLYEVSKGDHQDPYNVMQISFKDTLYDDGEYNNLSVVDVSCSFVSRELIAGMGNGSVVICKYGKPPVAPHITGNQDYRACKTEHANGDARIISLKGRVKCPMGSPSNFVPTSLVILPTYEAISCLKMSNVGFGAIGYTTGRLVICDISRGPAIILNAESLRQFAPSVSPNCYATSMEFAIMEFGQDGFSSLMLIVGTNDGGHLLVFKIVPKPNGAFEAVFADKTLGLNYRSKAEDADDSSIRQIIPITSKNGDSAVASPEIFQKLSQGVLIPGLVVAASDKDLRILKLPKTKLSHKVIEDTCLSCGIINVYGKGIVLATLVKSGFLKLSSLPSLSDIADLKFPNKIYEKFKDPSSTVPAFSSSILSNGTLFINTSISEMIDVVTYIKTGKVNDTPQPDVLFNENAVIPPRPAASALLWAKGQTKYISSQDLALLIGGPNRRTTKNIESQLAHNISPEANPSAGYGGYLGGNGSESDLNERGYKTPVRRGGNTSRGFGTTGFMKNLQDGIDSVEESFTGYANAVSENVNSSVEAQKRMLYTEALKSKFGI